MIILCVALFAAGHCCRDGWPSFKDMTNGVLGTQAARITGALFCAAGAIIAGGFAFGGIVGLAMLAGFFTDCRHGEGAGVDTRVAVINSFLSGVTSLVPLAIALAWFHSPGDGLIVLVGLTKPAIWKLAWLSNCRRLGWFWEPTRIAAMVFGAAIGLAVALIA